MLHTSHHLRLPAFFMIFIGLLPYSMLKQAPITQAQATLQSAIDPVVPTLIHRQKYNDAITRLEQILEREPQNSEALTYLATANLYQNLEFVKAQKEFEVAFKAGGGATFFVTHSHEEFTTDDIADYCRGFFHLRKDRLEFQSVDGTHTINVPFNQLKEFKQNRLSRKAFHIKFGGKSQNFLGRSNTELEVLLIIALYKSFAATPTQTD